MGPSAELSSRCLSSGAADRPTSRCDKHQLLLHTNVSSKLFKANPFWDLIFLVMCLLLEMVFSWFLHELLLVLAPNNSCHPALPRIMFANWSPPCRVLVENISEWFSAFFLLYRCVLGAASWDVFKPRRLKGNYCLQKSQQQARDQKTRKDETLVV